MNIKLSNSQLNKLKSGIKKWYWSNFHIQIHFDTQVSKMCKAFADGLSDNIKFLKTHLSKMIQTGRIFGDLIAAITQIMFLTGKEVSKKGISLSPKLAPILAGKAVEYYVNEPNKKFTTSKGFE